MTETAVEIKVISAVSNLLGNAPLEQAMQECYERLGPPPFDDIDRAFARRIQATLTDEDIATSYRRVGVARGDAALCDQIVPLNSRRVPMVGSTDVGDVSWVVPTVQAHGATYAIGTPGHSWQLTAQGKTPAAKKGMVHVAKVMAATAVPGDRGQDADRACQGRPGGADDSAAVCLPNPSRRQAAARYGGGLSFFPSACPLTKLSPSS